MKYFNTFCSCVEDLKKEYRRLTLDNHPNCGGSEQAMKEINAEYDLLFAEIGNVHRNAKGETYTNKKEQFYDGYDDGYRAVIDALAGLAKKGLITIELCGSWLWVGGQTREYKDYIKATGAHWSTNKGMWYWKPGEDTKKRRGKSWSIEKIRGCFGSTQLDFGTDRAPEIAIPF